MADQQVINEIIIRRIPSKRARMPVKARSEGNRSEPAEAKNSKIKSSLFNKDHQGGSYPQGVALVC